MTWRLAKSLEILREQINHFAPGRSKASDGTIGDAAHASRSSDHNPWVKDGPSGVVTALDITHDPKGGVDIQKLANALVASKDDRIKYIICNGRIVSGSGQKRPAWKWRPYHGSNSHSRHVHVSVKASKGFYDSIRNWRFDATAIKEVSPSDGVLKPGSRGIFVQELQGSLSQLGYAVRVDGVYGKETESAVRLFQQQNRLAVDGWAGPRTLNAIGERMADRAAKPRIAAAAARVPEQAEAEVKQKAGWAQKAIGFVTGGGGLGTLLYGIEWQTVAVILAGGLVAGLLVYLMRRQILEAYREINAGVQG